MPKTTHIVPRDDGWTIRKEREGFGPSLKGKNGDVLGRRRASHWAAKKPLTERRSAVYATQKQAIDAARELAQRSSESQIVIHNRNGSMQRRDVRGLPEVQTPPLKSDLGTNAIRRAVSAVIRERLGEK